jgi:hypothetical protein
MKNLWLLGLFVVLFGFTILLSNQRNEEALLKIETLELENSELNVSIDNLEAEVEGLIESNMNYESIVNGKDDRIKVLSNRLNKDLVVNECLRHDLYSILDLLPDENEAFKYFPEGFESNLIIVKNEILGDGYPKPTTLTRTDDLYETLSSSDYLLVVSRILHPLPEDEEYKEEAYGLIIQMFGNGYLVDSVEVVSVENEYNYLKQFDEHKNETGVTCKPFGN